MHISFATANLYQHSFDWVLGLIAEAGFSAIELDLFWERKEWAMAQHLRGVPAYHIAASIRQSGLRVTSIHDGGGVLENSESIAGYINPALDAMLQALGYAPDCLVFHTPHIEGIQDPGWWHHTEERIACALKAYQKVCPLVTVENTPCFDGYTVPLTAPTELAEFAAQHGLGVTLDTTHYAQMNVDVLAAAKTLRQYIRSVHLSDFRDGQTHVFVGEGDLDLQGILSALDPVKLNAITVECSLGSVSDRSELVKRMREARLRTQAYICASGLNTHTIP